MASRRPIGLLTEERYLIQAQPTGACEALTALGHRVDVRDAGTFFPTGDAGPWLDGVDVVVARGRSRFVLTLLGRSEARGMRTINRRASIASVLNKAEMAAALASADVKTPRTFVGSIEGLAESVSPDNYPLVLKPVFGDNCRGLRVVGSPDDLRGLSWPESIALAQPYLSGDGYDLKLYGIGHEIWAVRKRSPFSGGNGEASTQPTGGRDAELLPLSNALRNLGRSCGRLFGLELFGVDCLETSAGPVVIEVNDFPNYTGVPDADERLARYIISCIG